MIFVIIIFNYKQEPVKHFIFYLGYLGTGRNWPPSGEMGN